MKFSVQKFLCLVAMVALPSFSANAQPKPPEQNLQSAKVKIVSVKNRVDQLSRHTGGGFPDGGHDEESSVCSTIQSRSQCSEMYECTWRGGLRGGRCVEKQEGDGPIGRVEENDVAATFALQGMSHGLQQLYQDVDSAALNYYNPNFWFYWNKACQRTRFLLNANQAAKVAAALPMVGFIHPSEFVVFDQELHSVRSLLWCP